MANVIIFTDNIPSNFDNSNTLTYRSYQMRTAGAYAIASAVRHEGFSVLVVDHCASYTLAGIKKIINDNHKGLLWVGLSTTFFGIKSSAITSYRDQWQSTPDLYFPDVSKVLFDPLLPSNTADLDTVWGAAEINAISKFCFDNYQAKMLVGGVWVSQIEHYNLHNNVYIIRGRAEDAVKTITHQLAQDKSAKISTISSNTNYDDIPFKHSTYIWDESDNVMSNEWLPLEISRGCAFNCAFCAYDRKAKFDSYRTPESIRQELIANYKKFGTTKYMVLDDLYNDSKEKVRTLYDQVWSQLPFTPEWVSYIRLDLCWADPDSVEILKNSGLRMGGFGIETLNDIAGKKVGKGLGKKRILETLMHLRKVWKDDVLIHAFFIMGLPDEPEESMLETIDWIRTTDLIDSSSCNPLWVTPPSHRQFVVQSNPISHDNEKYKISWINNNTWVNHQGITFTRAAELAKQAVNSRSWFLHSWIDYAEYRQMGLSHKDVLSAMSNKRQVSDVSCHANVISKIRKMLKLTS